MIRKLNLSVQYFLFGALPCQPPPGGLDCDLLRRELAISELD